MSITRAFAQGKLRLSGMLNSFSLAGLRHLSHGFLSLAREPNITVTSRPLLQFQQCPDCEAELGAANEVYSRIAVCDHCGYHFVAFEYARKHRLPVVTVVSTGGARMQEGIINLMLQNAIYEVIAPEGTATILYRDTQKARQVAEQWKLTAADCLQLGVVDAVIPEPLSGCLLYTSPSPRDRQKSRMPSSA